MAKKPGRPRKVFVDSKDIVNLAELIMEGKEEEVKAKVDRKKEVINRAKETDPKPRPKDLQLKEAKTLAAAKLKEKKKRKKELKHAQEGKASGKPVKEEKPEGKERKRVSFG